MSRSNHWRDVASVAETTRTECEAFDPATGDAAACSDAGVAPLVSLYVRIRREGGRLSPVERSLLEGALTDWLTMFTACHDVSSGGGFTVREVVLAWTENGTLETTVRELVGVDAGGGVDRRDRAGGRGDGDAGGDDADDGR